LNAGKSTKEPWFEIKELSNPCCSSVDIKTKQFMFYVYAEHFLLEVVEYLNGE